MRLDRADKILLGAMGGLLLVCTGGTIEEYVAKNLAAREIGVPIMVEKLRGQLSADEFAKAKDAITCPLLNACTPVREPFNWKKVFDAVNGLPAGAERKAAMDRILEGIRR